MTENAASSSAARGTLNKRKSKHGSAASGGGLNNGLHALGMPTSATAAPAHDQQSEQQQQWFGSEQEWQKHLPSRTSTWLWQAGMMLLVAAGLWLSGQLAGGGAPFAMFSCTAVSRSRAHPEPYCNATSGRKRFIERSERTRDCRCLAFVFV